MSDYNQILANVQNMDIEDTQIALAIFYQFWNKFIELDYQTQMVDIFRHDYLNGDISESDHAYLQAFVVTFEDTVPHIEENETD